MLPLSEKNFTNQPLTTSFWTCHGLGRLETALCPGVLPPVCPTAGTRPRGAALAAGSRALVGTAVAGRLGCSPHQLRLHG